MDFGQKLWDECVRFHGHECPGLAIGFRASELAASEMGLSYSKDEEIVCVTENDACGVDAVQFITGCTFGKGNLIYRATGKMAFTFFNRKRNLAKRFIFNRPMQQGLNKAEMQKYIMSASLSDLFTMTEAKAPLPEIARLFTTVICEQCHEGAPEHKIRLNQGQKVCLDCFPTYRQGEV